jgi:hypothetical protein
VRDPVAVQGGQRREAVAEDVDRHPGLQPRLRRAGGQHHVLHEPQVLGRQPLPSAVQRGRGEHLPQVEPVHPLHPHDPDAAVRAEVVDGDEVLVLHGGDAGGDGRDPGHVLGVGVGGAVRLGREHLERDRQDEPVGALAAGEEHHALPAAADQPHVAAPGGPPRVAAGEDRPVARRQVAGFAAAGRAGQWGVGAGGAVV